MSQNRINLTANGIPFQLVAGFDRPLNHVFSSIWPLEELDENDPDAEYKLSGDVFKLDMASYSTAEQMVHAATTAGVSLPLAFIEALQSDTLYRAGNVMREFAADGTLLSSHGV